MALDHISLGVTDMKRAQKFYDAALAPLGVKSTEPLMVAGQFVGLGYAGADGHPRFWIQIPINGLPATNGNGVHIAFAAPGRAAVDEFYLAALAAGAADDGKPGLRTEYHPDYYGAFVRDPDGNKIEACYHGRE